MQDDWSKHISDLQIRTAKLIDAMNMRRYGKATDIIIQMIRDLSEVCAWIVIESANKRKR
jgi:hypothetical protein